MARFANILAVLIVAAVAATANAQSYVRLISLAKWNASADIATLAAVENNVTKACQSFFLAGTTGYSLQHKTDAMYGSYIKVFDFYNFAGYSAYQNCSSAQPGRLISGAYETWKTRLVFPFNATVLSSASTGTYWSAFVFNTTNPTNLVTALNKLNAEIGSLATVRQAGARVSGALSSPMDVAQVLAYGKPQGATAFLGYLNEAGGEGLPLVDTYSQVKSTITVQRRILFAPTKLK